MVNCASNPAGMAVMTGLGIDTSGLGGIQAMCGAGAGTTACLTQMSVLRDVQATCCSTEPDPASCSGPSAPPPTTCNPACAAVIGPFWSQCSTAIAPMLSDPTDTNGPAGIAFFQQCQSVYGGGH
eukprot:COSAG01_NODE_1015_length_12114_cov_214.545651_1_plen_125_part_00